MPKYHPKNTLGETMDSKTYLSESARTASNQFHHEIIDPAMLEYTLKQAISTGELVDIAKKSLFYGKKIKEGTDIQQFRNNESTLNIKAVHQDVLHAALGIYTEAAEMLEVILATMQGNEFDEINAFEELGDTEWYMAMMYRTLNKTPQEAKVVNIDKLRKRYPQQFTSSDAIHRNTNAEREILENGHNID
jgi:rubrerythrin